MAKILDIDTWLNFIFKVKGHKKLNQITTIKSFWTKTGDARAPLPEWEKDPQYWAPGTTLSDQHSYDIKYVMDIEQFVPNTKLSKVDLGRFAFYDVFNDLPEYVEYFPEYTYQVYWRTKGYETVKARIAKIDFGEFQAYRKEIGRNNDIWDELQDIYITVPRINVHYFNKNNDNKKLVKRLYIISTGNTHYYNNDFTVYKTPELEFPTKAKEFFLYMQDKYKIFGEKCRKSDITVWNKLNVGPYVNFPTDNITSEEKYIDYLKNAKSTRSLETHFKLPTGISINYNSESFAKPLLITQEHINEYINSLTTQTSPIEIIWDI